MDGSFLVVVVMSCIAVLIHGSIGGIIHITDETPSPYRLVVGGHLSLTCEYQTDAGETFVSSDLKFKKNDIEIPVGEEFKTALKTSGSKSTLTITSSRPDGLEIQDGGSYECRYKAIKFTKTVDVFRIEYTDDAQVPEENERNMNQDMTVKMECKAVFSIPPNSPDNTYSIEWSKGGTPVSQIRELQNRYTLGTHTITIHDVIRADMGEYQCTFVFSNNDKINQTVPLKASPKISKDFAKSTIVIQGSNWAVICPVTGFPYPTVYWTKDNEELKLQDKRIRIENNEKIVNSKLIINNLKFEDQGYYKCFANSTGPFPSTAATIKLTIKHPLHKILDYFNRILDLGKSILASL